MGLQVKKKDVERVFKKLDVEIKNNNHHVRGFIKINGERVIPVHYSHGRGDLPGKIPERLRKSFKLEKDEFLLLMQCTMTKSEYHSILKKRLI